ncbi:Blp family class II bacteriocin [Limosilactobacillus reuteri]|uniref:Blp family class II bacteriocin n=1 Tax=Limosilactobacillus reuteri TaxID=1598 RepID=UPI00129A6361|nr:Blp family class II bacteriocin [Limosilactobacillus reuteri]MRG63339.1 bacteriocin [Limosilactobacillus reuteri]
MKKLDNSQLKMILGGKNSWQQNVWGVARSTAAGAGLGAAICGPGCGFVGAHYGAIVWAGTTGATHGFH